MSAKPINLKRTKTVIRPDQSRVLLRPFNTGNGQRARNIIARVMALSESEVSELLDAVAVEFSDRHQQMFDLFGGYFEDVRQFLLTDQELSEKRKHLIGSYFSSEFSLESAALFNPSIVPHPDQSNLPSGALRFILSLRATGEGHTSCITFRSGTIHADNDIEIDPPTRYATEPRRISNPAYEKPLFVRKLFELNLADPFTARVMDRLGKSFVLEQLRSALDSELKEVRGLEDAKECRSTGEKIRILAESNCEVQFLPEQDISERTIFPTSPSQSKGIEDARFVRFDNGDGTHVYYATVTAYDGRFILSELIETRDFLHFRFITLNGPAVQNKGMAVFPRRINGHYAMISRQDNENIYLMYSDNIHFWYEPEVILRPTYPWEFVQLGNCGSPIETEAGWLVLSHGVGPMRKYCMGAFLLDRDDPSKVLGRLREPLLKPNDQEREGYVPNVVYTCGALLHGDELIIPYAMSDYASGFATVPVKEVLDAMQ
jgi:predicted GH43/DUF377 family glycosyl hydrolase